MIYNVIQLKKLNYWRYMSMKKFVALALSLICAISLVACGSKDRDRVEVYDKNQKMISEMTSRKDLKYFSDLITQSTENLKDPASAFAQLPKDAVVSREFRVITKDKDGKDFVIKFYVYENYQYMTLSGIQEMPDFTWKLSDEDYVKLKDMGK